MGIFDFLNTDDPMKQQSLLAAAAAMLQASGPSRTPTSFGQAVGSGVGAYQQSLKDQQDHARRLLAEQQQSKLLGLKIKDAESDLTNQDALRKQEAALNDFTTGYWKRQGGAQVGSADITGEAASTPTATVAPSGTAPGARLATDRNSIAQQRLAFAQALRQAGFSKRADSEEDGAIKLQPKYSTEFRTATGADGQLHNYVLADDGSWKDTGLGVRPDMTEMDLGGTKQFVDKNRVKPGQTFNKTLSPDAAASNALGWARFKYEKSQTEDSGSPASEAMVDAIGQGKIAPPSGFALRNPKIVAMMERVTQKYPEYDATEFAGKSKAMRDFTTGKQGDAIRSFAVATDHLTQLKGLITALDNGNTPLINRYANVIAQQTGSAAPTNFEAAKGIVAKEVLKSIVAGGGGVEERQELAHLLDNAKNGKQLMGVVDTYMHIMTAQRDGLMRQYEISTGRKDGSSRFNYGPSHNPSPAPPSAGGARKPIRFEDLP